VLIGLSTYFIVSIPVLGRKISRSRHDSTHLLCRCMLHLISLSLKQSEDPTWRHKYHPLNNFLHSKMTLNPKELLNVCQDMFPCSNFCWRLIDVTCNAVTASRQNPQQTNNIYITSYSRITSTKSLSFCFTTVNPSHTKFTALHLSPMITTAMEKNQYWQVYCSDVKKHWSTHIHLRPCSRLLISSNAR
jgi:hypothetical protein